MPNLPRAELTSRPADPCAVLTAAQTPAVETPRMGPALPRGRRAPAATLPRPKYLRRIYARLFRVCLAQPRAAQRAQAGVRAPGRPGRRTCVLGPSAAQALGRERAPFGGLLVAMSGWCLPTPEAPNPTPHPPAPAPRAPMATCGHQATPARWCQGGSYPQLRKRGTPMGARLQLRAHMATRTTHQPTRSTRTARMRPLHCCLRFRLSPSGLLPPSGRKLLVLLFGASRL